MGIFCVFIITLVAVVENIENMEHGKIYSIFDQRPALHYVETIMQAVRSIYKLF